jgi:hypothetical protein
MELLVYVYHPDATSLLVETLSELEEAVALCRELVAVDGYVRAEVWTEGGTRLYGAARDGGTLRTYDTRAEAETSLPAWPAPDPDPRTPADRPAAAAEPSPAAEPRPCSGDGPRILGQRPGEEVTWLGL